MKIKDYTPSAMKIKGYTPFLNIIPTSSATTGTPATSLT